MRDHYEGSVNPDEIKYGLDIDLVVDVDDIDNQNAAMLARDVDPKGERTIGVLTKVDTLEDVEREHWVKVLRNEKQPLLHGYYVSSSIRASVLQLI